MRRTDEADLNSEIAQGGERLVRIEKLKNWVSDLECVGWRRKNILGRSVIEIKGGVF
jgi:hypothetical protein